MGIRCAKTKKEEIFHQLFPPQTHVSRARGQTSECVFLYFFKLVFREFTDFTLFPPRSPSFLLYLSLSIASISSRIL